MDKKFIATIAKNIRTTLAVRISIGQVLIIKSLPFFFNETNLKCRRRKYSNNFKMTLERVLNIETTSFLNKKTCVTRWLLVFRPCSALILLCPLSTSTDSELTIPKYVTFRTKARKRQETSPLTLTTWKILVRRLQWPRITNWLLRTFVTPPRMELTPELGPSPTLTVEILALQPNRWWVKLSDASTQCELHPRRPMVKTVLGEKRHLWPKVVAGPVTPICMPCPGVQIRNGLMNRTLAFNLDTSLIFRKLQLIIELSSRNPFALQSKSLTDASRLKPLLIFPTMVTVRWLPHRITVPLLSALAYMLTLDRVRIRWTYVLRGLKIPFLWMATPSLGLKVAKKFVITLRKLPNMDKAYINVNAVNVILYIETLETTPTVPRPPPEKRQWWVTKKGRDTTLVAC